MKPALLSICLLALVGCQLDKTFKTQVQQYANGKPSSVKTISIKKNRGFELHNNFRQETQITRTFYPNGKPCMYLKVVYTNGADARCYESFYRLEQYDSTGVKRSVIENKCDCQFKKEWTYNAKGKLLKKHKIVIKRIE